MKVTNEKYRNVLERAGWTFVQTFMAAVILVPAEEWSADLARTAALAGLAAVFSLVKTVAQDQLAASEEEG